MEPRTFDTPDGLHLELRIPSGSINVETADISSTTVEIRGEKDANEFRIELTPLADGGHRLRIHQERRAFQFGWTREVSVHVRAPGGVTVDAESGSADLEVDGDAGSIAFRSGSGDLRFSSVRGDVTAKCASGDINGGSVAGGLVAHTASGDVEVGSAVGRIVARSASGDVRVGHAPGPVQATTASGDLSFGGLAHGEATLRSVSGDIDVGIATGTRVWLDLSSVSGDTRSDLDPSDAPEEGRDLVELRAQSVSGDIRVRSDARGAS